MRPRGLTARLDVTGQWPGRHVREYVNQNLTRAWSSDHIREILRQQAGRRPPGLHCARAPSAASSRTVRVGHWAGTGAVTMTRQITPLPAISGFFAECTTPCAG